jgi:hypothetical protein
MAFNLDSAGNSYVTGFFMGTTTFGNTTLTAFGNNDAFVAKMDSNGNWLWAKHAGGTGNCGGAGIAFDTSGNIYIIGNYNGNANFGTHALNTSGSTDIFVTKLDSEGNWVWAKSAGGSWSDAGRSIATDNSGNVYLTGDFERTAAFGTTTLSTPIYYDIFVAKLDTDGNWSWAKQAGSPNSDSSVDIAVDGAGDAYITGYFTGSAAFGDSTLTGSYDDDVFVAKLDTVGDWMWAVKAGGVSNDNSSSIAIDSQGNSYINGQTDGPANFGSIVFAGYTGFVAKLGISGNWLWVIPSVGSATSSIATDNSANVYLTGGFSGIVVFGSTTLYPTGSSDIFAAKLDTNGDWQWAISASGSSEVYAVGIVPDNATNTYLAGYFYQSASFGTSTLSSVGGKDIFVAKINTATGISDDLSIPTPAFVLKQNYPNPFNHSSKISIIVTDNKVPYQLSVYDLRGRLIDTLYEGKLLLGENIFTLQSNKQICNLPSGVYYYRLTNGSFIQTRKMVVLN